MEHPAVTEFRKRALAFDTETHLIQPGLLAPPLVCGSEAFNSTSSGIVGEIATVERARDAFREMVEDASVIVGANLPYDLVVMAADAYRTVERDAAFAILVATFDKLARGEVFDVQIAQALDAIAGGHLFKDPITGEDMRG